MELVLCCLNPCLVTTLNFSGTVTASGVLHLFLHHIEMFLTQVASKLCKLETFISIYTIHKELIFLCLICIVIMCTSIFLCMQNSGEKKRSFNFIWLSDKSQPSSFFPCLTSLGLNKFGLFTNRRWRDACTIDNCYMFSSEMVRRAWRIDSFNRLIVMHFYYCFQDNCALSDLTLSSCQISMEEKDKLVR